MKPLKKLIAVSLCLIMLLASSTIILANDFPSPWAQEQVNLAISENLVPQHLRSNYTQAITRAEFSALAVALYENLRGEITGRVTFTDTNDTNIEKIAYLGVVSGVGNNMFNPNGTLTREQAAVILSNLSEALNGPTLAVPRAMPFNDGDSISNWAVDSVLRVFGIGLMSGLDDNRFAPQEPYTREQSIVTIMRLFALSTPVVDIVPPIGDISTEIIDSEPGFEVGEVSIVSNGVIHEPYIHFVHGLSGGLSASGLFRNLEEIYDLLPVVEYAEDFMIHIVGDDAVQMDFTLYDSNFVARDANVYIADGDLFAFAEEGAYILSITISWSYQDKGSEFIRNEYLFKIVR